MWFVEPGESSSAFLQSSSAENHSRWFSNRTRTNFTCCSETSFSTGFVLVIICLLWQVGQNLAAPAPCTHVEHPLALSGVLSCGKQFLQLRRALRGGQSGYCRLRHRQLWARAS